MMTPTDFNHWLEIFDDLPQVIKGKFSPHNTDDAQYMHYFLNILENQLFIFDSKNNAVTVIYSPITQEVKNNNAYDSDLNITKKRATLIITDNNSMDKYVKILLKQAIDAGLHSNLTDSELLKKTTEEVPSFRPKPL